MPRSSSLTGDSGCLPLSASCSCSGRRHCGHRGLPRGACVPDARVPVLHAHVPCGTWPGALRTRRVSAHLHLVTTLEISLRTAQVLCAHGGVPSVCNDLTHHDAKTTVVDGRESLTRHLAKSGTHLALQRLTRVALHSAGRRSPFRTRPRSRESPRRCAVLRSDRAPWSDTVPRQTT